MSVLRPDGHEIVGRRLGYGHLLMKKFSWIRQRVSRRTVPGKLQSILVRKFSQKKTGTMALIFETRRQIIHLDEHRETGSKFVWRLTVGTPVTGTVRTRRATRTCWKSRSKLLERRSFPSFHRSNEWGRSSYQPQRWTFIKQESTEIRDRYCCVTSRLSAEFRVNELFDLFFFQFSHSVTCTRLWNFRAVC